MKASFGNAILLTYVMLLSSAYPTPPGYNPNLSIEEQRRQEEILRKQRESLIKEKANQHFDEDASVQIQAYMVDALSGEKIDGIVSFVIVNSGKTYTFPKIENGAHIARVRKISDIQVIFASPEYFSVVEPVPLNTLKPLEKLDISAKLLRKPGTGITAGLDILFDADSSILKTKFHEILFAVAKTLRSNPTLSLVIKGYAGRDAATEEAARRISQARANAVRDFLMKVGIAKSQLQAVSMGVDDGEKDAAREYRAELLLIDLND